MKFDLETLTAEPLIYMLMHSGAFVAVLGAVFFIVGLLFGYATWGRYKRHTRDLRGEAASMKDEIAQLKRKVADLAVKSGVSVHIATETIHMPRNNSVEGNGASAIAVDSGAPATEESRPLTSQTNRPSTKNRLQRPLVNVIKSRTLGPPPAPVELSTLPTVEPLAKPVPTAEPATAKLVDTEVPPPPAPARHTSPLAAIIATPPPVKEEGDAESTPASGLVPPDDIPTLTESIAPLKIAAEITPEDDPRLGLIYKTRPEKIDDLTALKGISQMLEHRLHELGVYTYAQIAVWNDEHVREFSSSLSFKDRIQREHWVEQARQLLVKQTAASLQALES